MRHEDKNMKEKFDALFADWERVIQDPRIRLSSKPQDYTDNEPYRELVKLGHGALPFMIEKLEQVEDSRNGVEASRNGGVFFLNQAVVEITGIQMDEIIGKGRRFPSEQEKSTLLVKWWRSQ